MRHAFRGAHKGYAPPAPRGGRARVAVPHRADSCRGGGRSTECGMWSSVHGSYSSTCVRCASRTELCPDSPPDWSGRRDRLLPGGRYGAPCRGWIPAFAGMTEVGDLGVTVLCEPHRVRTASCDLWILRSGLAGDGWCHCQSRFSTVFTRPMGDILRSKWFIQGRGTGRWAGQPGAADSTPGRFSLARASITVGTTRMTPP